MVDILKIYPRDKVEDLIALIEALDSGLPVDPEKMRELCNAWLDWFHSSGLEWHWLSPTMHLLLHHGPDIVRIFPCGAGLMSEEPSE